MTGPSSVLFATPGGDENHPWAQAFLDALRTQVEVSYCPAELSAADRAKAEETVPPATPTMRRIMAERSRAATALRREAVERQRRGKPRRDLQLQLYTNDVLPPDLLDAVFTDIFLANVVARSDELPGVEWSPEFVSDALARERASLERCRRVYVTSQWVAASGRDDLGLGKRVVEVGVGPVVCPAEAPPPRDSALPPRLLFIGNDADRKGLDLLLEAFGRVRRERANVELAVVGRATFETDLPVIRHGFVDTTTVAGRERLGQVLSDASLFVLPTRFDPVGVAFLDAMSHALPIVGPPDCMVPEFLEDGVTGRFSARTVEDLTRTILSCLGDPAACVAMGRRARERQQQYFRWDLVVGRLLADWRSVMRGEARS